MRITWKKQPDGQGLMRIGQGERGFDLCIDGAKVASVRPLTGDRRYDVIGWYWYCSSDKERGIEFRNTSDLRGIPLQEAKEQAEVYIRECVKLPKKK